MMGKYQFLFLAALIGSWCEDAVSTATTTKSERHETVFCSTEDLPTSRSSSVHSLTPADVAVIFSLTSSPALRSESAKMSESLTELLSMFNPEVTSTTTLQTRDLSEEQVLHSSDLFQVNELMSRPSTDVSPQSSSWKLVLMLVSDDLLCPCATNVYADLQYLVQQAGAALQVLQQQFPRTLVHVVVWSSGLHQDISCECLRRTNPNLQRAVLLKMLQEMLQKLVDDPKLTSDDFTVLLQPEPLVSDPSSNFDMDRLVLQLWTGLLQLPEKEVVTFPCPSKTRAFLRTRVNTPALRPAASMDSTSGTEVPCSDRRPSAATPTSVHELRPGDVKVVAAVGDSLTAGNGVGAKVDDSLLSVINEYRGLSWCIGGDANISSVTTLPNILKEFNPNVTGFAEGICKQDDPAAFLNQAVAGAKSSDMLVQVRTLVDKMKSDPRIDFHDDWKVITMFIGSNDLCDFCTDSLYFSARNVVGRVRRALDLLHSEVPRAMVNLVELLSMVPLRDLHKDQSLGCPTWFVSLVCPCVLKPKDGSQELEKVNDFNRAYQHAMRTLVDSGRYDTHGNFTVVLQPFLREVVLPVLEDGRPDRSFFSPDCFHLSQKAHTLMARSLWNNMFEPVGDKTFTQDFTAAIDLKCPSERVPFIRTALNSNYTFSGPPPTTAPATNWGSDFSCAFTSPSNSIPTSAHKIRPADIKVVAALGDSITAAFGAKAKNLLQLRTEYRGVSWSIGGDKTLETVTTLPNILKKFNPDVKGSSKGTGKRKTGFNMSVSGAKIAGIPGQVRALIDAMKNDSTVDFQRDWKLVTLFIGGNDLCQYCNDRASLSPQNFSAHMRTSLDLLHAEMPRTIVNILEILEVEGLRRIKRDSLGCNLLQELVCPCFLLPSEDSPELAEVKRYNRDLQVETEKLVDGGRYDDREDFTVVLQTFLRNTEVPLNQDARPDDSYFSRDCFHFSERGHADMAAALWNNMLEPVGEKQTFNQFSNSRSQLRCPSQEQPYIFTRINSREPNVAPTLSPVTPGPPEVPLWLAIVPAVLALLLGCFLTWLVLTCRTRQHKKVESHAEELKHTGF